MVNDEVFEEGWTNEASKSTSAAAESRSPIPLHRGEWGFPVASEYAA